MLVVRCLRTTGKLIAMLGLSGAAMAAEPDLMQRPSSALDKQPSIAAQAELISLDLPRMPLHDALQRFSSVTGRSWLGDTRQVGIGRGPLRDEGGHCDEMLVVPVHLKQKQ